ncbi:MAG TPA: DUF4185 domain-containing protein [Terriglobia bacterium]|nr:DUF4185 domain-containing protein [Terriglobia bacterium]
MALTVPSLCAQNEAPYRPSPVIKGAVWDFKRLIRLANTPGKGGSDLWPATWAKDGNVYTGWGDGGGFEGASDNVGRVSLGFARIIGFPPQVKGVNVWGYYPKYAKHPTTFCGKAYSMLSVDGILYAWISSWYNPDAANFVRCAPNPRPPQDRLAWSKNLAATWTLSPWRLEEGPGQPTQFASFLNFGMNYGHARDQYVYEYLRIRGEQNATYLSRVRPADLQKDPTRSGTYEYYTGRGPMWSAQVSKARPVFVDPNGREIMHVVYNPGLRRYIASVQGHGVGETGLFDAPEPWGPWTTVAYYRNWGGFGGRESLGVDFPTKWISRDGTIMWAVFSGGRLGRRDDALDSFNLVKLKLVLRTAGASVESQTAAHLPP